MTECTYETLLSVSTDAKCEFVQQSCGSLSSYFDFLKFFYCDLDESIPLIILVSIIFIFIIFNFLAAIADTYLAPALEVLAKKLKLSETVAGITLLAFAASAPDVVTGVVAGGREDTGVRVVVGGLFGACLFTVTIVLAGCILGTKQILADKAALVRDVSFLALAVVYFLFLTTLSEITPLEVSVFFIIYVAFIVFVVFQERRKKKKSFESLKEKLLVLEIESSVVGENQTPLDKHRAKTLNTNTKIDMGILKDIKSVGEMPENDHKITASSMRIQMRKSLRRISSEEKSGVILAKNYTNEAGLPKSQFYRIASLKAEDKEVDDGSCIAAPQETESICKKLIRWVNVPILLIGDITMPAFEAERWNMLMTACTPVLGPLLIIAELGAIPTFNSKWYLWIIFGAVTLSFSFLIIAIGRKKNLAETYSGTFATISLVVSIFWLNLISSLIVDFLTFIQVLTGLSMYLLSITILAWGNSLEDYFVNYAISKKGFGKTALGGVYGSQIFAILIGFGLGLLRLSIESPVVLNLYDFTPDNIRENIITLFLLATILLVLILTLLGGKMNSWLLDRKLVIFVLSCYVIFVLAVILLAFV